MLLILIDLQLISSDDCAKLSISFLIVMYHIGKICSPHATLIVFENHGRFIVCQLAFPTKNWKGKNTWQYSVNNNSNSTLDAPHCLDNKRRLLRWNKKQVNKISWMSHEWTSSPDQQRLNQGADSLSYISTGQKVTRFVQSKASKNMFVSLSWETRFDTTSFYSTSIE